MAICRCCGRAIHPLTINPGAAMIDNTFVGGATATIWVHDEADPTIPAHDIPGHEGVES